MGRAFADFVSLLMLAGVVVFIYWYDVHYDGEPLFGRDVSETDPPPPEPDPDPDPPTPEPDPEPPLPEPEPEPPVPEPEPEPEPPAPDPEPPAPEPEPEPPAPEPEPEPPAPEPEPEPPAPEPEPEPPAPEPEPVPAPVLFLPPGELIPGSGTGRADDTIYAPGIRFPIENPRAFANSQVWGAGGFRGPAGGQCAASNYNFPWRDNFCETRGYATPMCPAGTGHQGQDIRPPSCDNRLHWAVAVSDGDITSIGTYSVRLTDDEGRRFTYLHLDPASLQVSAGQRVSRGQRIGLVSNAFGGTPTTIHLHFEIRQSVLVGSDLIATPVPPYASLVAAYQEAIAED